MASSGRTSEIFQHVGLPTCELLPLRLSFSLEAFQCYFGCCASLAHGEVNVTLTLTITCTAY